MMTVDTRNGIMAVIAMGTLAFVVAVSAVGIVILAVAHDGDLSAQAMSAFTQILLGAGAGGVLLGAIERITSAATASKAISAGASVTGSPVSVTNVSTEPVSGVANANGAAVAGAVDDATEPAA